MTEGAACDEGRGGGGAAVHGTAGAAEAEGADLTAEQAESITSHISDMCSAGISAFFISHWIWPALFSSMPSIHHLCGPNWLMAQYPPHIASVAIE